MTAELFIEVRCEELPARFVALAARELAAAVAGLIKGIDHGAITTWSTPRRVAVSIADVAAGKPVQEQIITGPPERAAFKDGAPTRAAQGFARGKGVSVDDLFIHDGPRGRVVAVKVQTGGEQTVSLVADGLEAAILGIRFPKSMRWSTLSAAWARPIQGITAVYDGALIQTSVLGQQAAATSTGHRLAPEAFAVTGSESWLEGLRAHYVEADPAARRAAIEAQLREAAGALGATIEDWDLVDEVVDLVEWPVAVTASFGEDLLELPPRLLVEAMKIHQRVFPLYIDGKLDHHFLVISNQPFATDAETAQIIANGNRRVLTARFYDARFFYAEDRKKGLLAAGERLSGMQWIRSGGTMADKAARLEALAEKLAGHFRATPAVAARAGALCKNDLATQMVTEFPKLQGHVGNLLARIGGEPDAVATAIEEHYLPRYQGDSLPATPAGMAVAVADRLDSLVGCFQRNLQPKGSSDPLGLRRAAIGTLQLLLHSGVRLQMSELIAVAAPDGVEALEDFVLARARAMLSDEYGAELVSAVLETGDRDIVALDARLKAMAALAATDEFGPLKTTFKRVMGLTKEHTQTDYDVSALDEASEVALHEAFMGVRDEARVHSAALRYAEALAALSSIKPAVDRFFDDVLVMHDDPAVRGRRLSLLRAIGDEFRQIADFTQLSAES